MSEEKTDWLDVSHAGVETVREAAFGVRRVAKMLAYTAPQSAAVEELMGYALALGLAAENLEKATRAKVVEDLRQAEAGSLNMLRATLAGVVVAGCEVPEGVRKFITGGES